MAKETPVYLFTGLLEAGKTKYIQETLEDPSFNEGERTLLILCEQGVEEYQPARFSYHNVTILTIEEEAGLSADYLQQAQDQCQAERVIIEYNGTWLLDSLYAALPENWLIYQEFCFMDASTFLSYNANMRQLVYDKLTSAQLVIFNRFGPEQCKEEFHKLVRGASRGADIIYEYQDGTIEPDEIEDPLPFDIDAALVEIKDEDYAFWYRDISAEPDKYDGKRVTFKARAAVNEKLPAGYFVPGRHVMTCCEADIAFMGFLCQFNGVAELQNRDWVQVTATIKIGYHKAYKGRGPLLQADTVELALAPEQEIATFF